MKELKLTGVGSEQNFNRIPNGASDRFDKLGKARYYLVFNEGELRVPCTEEAAQVVIEHMYAEELRQSNGNGNGHHEEAPEQFDGSAQDSEVVEEDEGADQI